MPFRRKSEPPDWYLRLTLDDMDVWAMRDAGFVDPELRVILLERGEGDLDPDYIREPTVEQKSYALEKYEQLSEYLNSQRFDGRTDWTPREAWGLGRAAIAIAHGFGAEVTKTIVPWPIHVDDE